MNRARKLYLDLLELSLCDLIYRDGSTDGPFDLTRRETGRDWPIRAHTMIGRHRLSHLRTLAERVIQERIPGDLIETGVWRGGACIMMRGVLQAHDAIDRVVHVADSFQGLPPPDPDNYPADAGSNFHTYKDLAISREEVEEIFRRYGLLDGQVRFHEGWFKDTLPRLGDTRFALIRLDGDMYESTWTALEELYPRLNPGGFVVVDDYSAIGMCKKAIDEYRGRHDIAASLIPIDWSAVFWRKPI